MKQPHDGFVVRTDYKLVHFNSRNYNGVIVQLQSALIDDDNFFKHVPRSTQSGVPHLIRANN